MHLNGTVGKGHFRIPKHKERVDFEEEQYVSEVYVCQFNKLFLRGVFSMKKI